VCQTQADEKENSGANRKKQEQMSTGMFSGLKEAKTYGKGTYCQPGNYKVRVVKAIMNHSTRGKGDAFIVEFKIEKSNYIQRLAEAKAAGPVDLVAFDKIAPNKEDTTASWYQSMKDPAVAFGAIKAFAAGVQGEDPENQAFVDGVEAFMDAVVDTPQKPGALTGVLIPLEVKTIKKRDGGDFSLHVWGEAIVEGN
jgi:hypothetical protein